MTPCLSTWWYSNIVPRQSRSWLLLLLLGLTAVACSSARSTVDGTISLDDPFQAAAIVPQANMIGQVNFVALRQSEVIKEMQSGEALKLPKAAEDHRKAQEIWAKLEKATGLTWNDLLSGLLSAHTTSVKASEPSREQTEIDGVLALSLAKPLNMGTLAAALKLLGDEDKIEIRSGELAKTAILIATKLADPADQTYLSLVDQGRMVYITFNEQSMATTLARQQHRQKARLASELMVIKKRLVEDAHVQLLYVAPALLGTHSEAPAASPRPSNRLGRMLGILTSLRSLSMNIHFAQEAQLRLDGEFGSNQDALQSAVFVRLMLIPLMMSAMADAPDGNMPELLSRLKVETRGPIVRLSLMLTAEDLLNARLPPEGETAPAVPGEYL